MKADFWLMLVLLICVPILPVQAQTRGSTPVSTVPPVPVPVTVPAYSYGMIGMSAGQIMRVVATNVGTAPPTASPVAIPACGVDVMFFDMDGNAVGLGGHVDSLPSGKSFAVEQPGPTTVIRSEYRAQVQVAIAPATTNTGGILSPLLVCNIISTVQVYDSSTGKTDVVLTGNPLVLGYIPGPPCQTGPVPCMVIPGGPMTGTAAFTEGNQNP